MTKSQKRKIIYAACELIESGVSRTSIWKGFKDGCMSSELEEINRDLRKTVNEYGLLLDIEKHKTEKLESALNKIAILSSGDTSTRDFDEQLKQIVRTALNVHPRWPY